MGGAAPIISGYTYFGSCAQLVCLRAPDVLWAVKNGDTVIWIGPVYKTDADSEGKSVLLTTIGTIHFYWGLPAMTRDPASLLDNLTMDFGEGPVTVPMPQYRNCCYALLVDCSFGSQTAPPTLIWHIGRSTSGLTLDGKVGYIQVTAGGTGCTTATTAAIAGDGSGALVTPVVVDGKVVHVQIDDPGTGYTTATISFGGAGSGATGQVFLNHQIDGDCNLVEATYELLTDTLYGGKVDPADIDTASFEAAADIVAAENLGASPLLDQPQTIREIIGGWNFYVDGYLRFENGKIQYQLRRPLTSGELAALDLLTDADLLEEPIPKNPIHGGTWNMTRVSFNDRFNNWEQTGEPYDDPAHADMVERSVDKTFDFPFVTRREVAKKIALRLGSRGGVPVVAWTLRLKPSHETRAVGSLFKITHPKLGVTAKVMRVTEVSRYNPTEPEVEMTVIEENMRATDNDYLPASDDLAVVVPTVIGPDGGDAFAVSAAQPRCAILPEALKAGKPDGWLVAVARPDVVSTRVNDSFDYYPLTAATWINQGTHIGFPRIGTIIWCEPYRGNWLLRVTIETSFDMDSLFNLAAATDDIFFVTGQRSVGGRTAYDRHELMPLWGHKVVGGRMHLVDAVTLDIEVDFGDYATPEPAYETLSAYGIYPTSVIYFGRMAEFIVRPQTIYVFDRAGLNYPSDTEHVRAIRTQIGNVRAMQAIADAGQCTFKPLDTTDNPDGTYDPNWGTRVLSAAEYLDVHGGDLTDDGFPVVPYFADIDEELGNMVEGDVTPANQELFAGVDEVLGNMVTSGDTSIYSDVL